jgi:hypothetical protein
VYGALHHPGLATQLTSTPTVRTFGGGNQGRSAPVYGHSRTGRDWHGVTSIATNYLTLPPLADRGTLNCTSWVNSQKRRRTRAERTPAA